MVHLKLDSRARSSEDHRHRTIAVGNMPDVIVKIPCGGGDAAKGTIHKGRPHQGRGGLAQKQTYEVREVAWI